MRSFARTWTTDLKGRRIRVNAVSPGSTPGLSELLASSEVGQQRLKMLANAVPLGRLGTPDEIAQAVVFLASDDSSYVTGTELFVDEASHKFNAVAAESTALKIETIDFRRGNHDIATFSRVRRTCLDRDRHVCGSLKDVPAPTLGAVAISAAVARAGLRPDEAETVVMGNVVQAGTKMNPARQAAVHAGLPVTTPALTVNRVCGSGAQAIVSAAQDDPDGP